MPVKFNLAEDLVRTVQRTPYKVFIKTIKHPPIEKEVEITYEEFNKLVNRLGNGLKRLGVGKGDKVAAFLPYNWPEMFVFYYAVWKIGAVAVPIDHLFKAREAEYVINHSDAIALITSKGYYNDYIASIREKLKNVKHYIVVDGRGMDGTIDYQELLSNSSEDLEVEDVNPDDLAMIAYTSGTTGIPKGCMQTHGNIKHVVSYGVQPMSSDDRILVVVPSTHSYVNCALMPAAVRIGATLYLMGRFNPVKALEVIEKYKITIMTGSPTVFAYLLDAYESMPRKPDVSSLQGFTTGSAPVGEKLWKRVEEVFYNARIYEYYGLTETCVTVTADNWDGRRRHGSAGRPILGTRVKIMDLEGKKELPPGQLGEVWVKGPQVIKGYYKDPERTKETFIDGWVRTGDLGYMDEDGYLYIKGRIKEVIKAKGYSVDPADIEDVVKSHPKVLDCAAVGIPHEKYGEEIVVFVVLREKGPVDEKELEKEIIEYCKKNLADFKVPSHVKVIDELPRTTIGKVQKFKLKELAQKLWG
jgi:long-chain acyl-CoA synthetase